MLRVAMQSSYAPFIILLFFAVIVSMDKLFSQKIKRLFLIEIILQFFLITVSCLDSYFASRGAEGTAWRLRSITTCLGFTIGPCSPMILVLIYDMGISGKILKIFYVPQIINLTISVLSLWTGWVYSVNSSNVYSRGPLFPLSLTVGFFYLFTLIVFSARQQKKPNKEAETLFLSAVFLAIGSAAVMEVFFRLRLLIWNVSSLCVILYFLLLTTQKILYDSMTGTYSRTAYERQMEKVNRIPCTVTMIDLNNLKQLNDQYGHSVGDAAICGVTEAILKQKSRYMKLYRYGGDEFVMVSNRICEDETNRVLQSAKKQCCMNFGMSVSFSYGTAVHQPGEDIYDAVLRADETMYRYKAKGKITKMVQ